MYMYTYEFTDLYISIYIHVYTHMHTYTHTHTYAHTHKNVLHFLFLFRIPTKKTNRLRHVRGRRHDLGGGRGQFIFIFMY